jgi:hypothetical protein
MAADKAPDQPKAQQRHHHEAQAHVPGEGVAADLARDHQTDDRSRQQPVEGTRGQVPHAHGGFGAGR